MATTPQIDVYVLTYCRDEKCARVATIVFETLRVGFPSARVHVVDNASLIEHQAHIRSLAERADASFEPMEREIPHHVFLSRVVDTHPQGCVVFLDPDICFWRKVESWTFAGLMAGRALPCFACEYTGCITHQRLHTSFLWISDVDRLRSTISRLRRTYIDFDPFRPLMFRRGGEWHRLDTCGSLCAAIVEQLEAFSPHELEAYDHLFCSTHGDRVSERLRPDFAVQFQRLHNLAANDYRIARGAWRLQQAYFESRQTCCCPRMGEVGNYQQLSLRPTFGN